MPPRLVAPRLQPLLHLAGLYLLLSVLLRLALWASFGLSEGVGLASLPFILGAGILNDGVELLYLLGPLSLYLCLLPAALARRRWHGIVLAAALYLALFGMLYLTAAEYFFFEEFDARFNLVAVDYLLYPHEVLVNLWDSYPVIWVLLADSLASAALLRWLWPGLRRSLEQASPLRVRAPWLAGHAAMVLLALVGFSTDTMARSQNRVADELSANGISSLFRAFRTNELDYDVFYRTLEPGLGLQVVQEWLAEEEGRPDRTWLAGLDRSHPADPGALGRRNVVVIVEESFGAGYVGAYGDARGLTPEFDRLSRDGLLFRNAFATGTRTVRGLEAIVASFPPLPGEAILKRAGGESLYTWGTVMRSHGYRTSFLYGGFSYFDNMAHFFGGNGFEVVDRGDIANPVFANIWGVCDEDLFRHAIGYFDHQGKEGGPFFSLILTTSNHKPYTFPQGVPGVPAEGGGRTAGVRYADYALGKFFEEASRHAWFHDTVFVVIADHDARVYGRAQIPVEHYRIPLLVYAPGLVAPGEVIAPISQMDVAPTVLGRLGLAYTAPFFGQDVLAARGDRGHAILLSHNHDVALLLGDELEVLGLQRAASTFRYDSQTGSLARRDEAPNLRDLTTAFYQTAFDLFRSGRSR